MANRNKKEVTATGALKRLSILELELLSNSDPKNLRQIIQSVLKLKVELRRVRDKYQRLK